MKCVVIARDPLFKRRPKQSPKSVQIQLDEIAEPVPSGSEGSG